jgi:hypothetical protein
MGSADFYIITANGTKFKSHEFEQWLKEYGIRHVITPPYHTRGNAGVERFSQMIKQGLRAQLAGGKSIAEALRLIVQLQTVSPFSHWEELMMGRKLRQPLSQLLPHSRAESADNQLQSEEQVQKVLQRQQQMKQYTDHRRKAQSSQFQPGSWVRIKRPAQRVFCRSVFKCWEE